jgi:hypothetical protein
VRSGNSAARPASVSIAKSLDHRIPMETVRQALARLKLTIVPFDEEHAIAAAKRRFGKTVRNPQSVRKSRLQRGRLSV